MMDHVYIVILAGGEGTRFQPYSTPERPKQFLPITHKQRSMLQVTYDRLIGLVPAERIWISTNQRYIDLVLEQLPQVDTHHIIGEPIKKNTAPAIALLNQMIHRYDPNAVVAFLPADHFIAETDKFQHDLKKAFQFAAWEDTLVTFGIAPTFPSSDYGYIIRNKPVGRGVAYTVQQFIEKPDQDRAQKLINDTKCYWNGGMFVWQASTFIQTLEKHVPQLSTMLNELCTDAQGNIQHDWLQTYFQCAPSVSVDYAVLEKANNVSVFPFSSIWSDVGTWSGLSRLVKRFDLDLPADIKNYLL